MTDGLSSPRGQTSGVSRDIQGFTGSLSCNAGEVQVGFFELMKACWNFGDILGVGRPQLEEMQRIGDAYASSEVPGGDC